MAKDLLKKIAGREKVFGYATKEVECLKCGNTMRLAKDVPLRESWCLHCRALGKHLRIFGPGSCGYVAPSARTQENSNG